MDDLVKIATQQLEERAKALKWEMEKAIDEKVENTKDQLGRLGELKVPLDILDMYMKTNGKVWVSKTVGVEEDVQFRLLRGGRDLFYPNTHSREPEFKLPLGVYKLVLIAIPQEFEVDKGGCIKDGYDSLIHIQRDC